MGKRERGLISKKSIGLLFFLIFLFAWNKVANIKCQAIYDEGVEATCTESGYKIIEKQGVVTLEEIPPLGHQFNEWEIDYNSESKKHTCKICGYEEIIHLSSIPEETLPRLELSGSMDGIGRKNRVALKAKYSDSEQSFECYGLLTLQGHSTYGLPKKNYTIRFYDDAEGTIKHRVCFRDWNAEHKYILKANYMDVSQSRNIVGANIWSSIVQSRNNNPVRLNQIQTKGAVDGFPIAVYFNGDFFGLYTLNLHKDEDLYMMKKNKQEAIVICNEQTMEESLFRSEALFLPNNESDWEIEYCGTADQEWVKDSFNTFITFVMESGEIEFHDRLHEYLDVDAAIDYLIFIHALGLENSGAKDLVMLSYGDQWIPSAYDMDEAFGLDALKPGYREPAEFLPQCSEGQWDSGTGSLLWDRLMNAFWEKIRERYHELREGPISNQSLLDVFSSYTAQIPESFYDYDWYLYPGRSLRYADMLHQIEQYIPARMKLLDEIYLDGEEIP